MLSETYVYSGGSVPAGGGQGQTAYQDRLHNLVLCEMQVRPEGGSVTSVYALCHSTQDIDEQSDPSPVSTYTLYEWVKSGDAIQIDVSVVQGSAGEYRGFFRDVEYTADVQQNLYVSGCTVVSNSNAGTSSVSMTEKFIELSAVIIEETGAAILCIPTSDIRSISFPGVSILPIVQKNIQSGNVVEVTNNSLNIVNGTLLLDRDLSIVLPPRANSDEAPNFALQITPNTDCNIVITATGYNGGNPLMYSEAGGNSIVSGKHYQITCVGDCWTLAEFLEPSAQNDMRNQLREEQKTLVDKFDPGNGNDNDDGDDNGKHSGCGGHW